MLDSGSWKAKGETGPESDGSQAPDFGRVRVGGERRGRLAGECVEQEERGESGRGGCEVSASERRGAACSKRPRRLPSGRSLRRGIVSSSASSSVAWRLVSRKLVSCSDLVGELAVDIDMALEESESDSSLILVLRGSRTWC